MAEQDSAVWFDPDFYSSVYGVNRANAFGHFLRRGAPSGFAPSPYFSTRHYNALYPDWAQNGATLAIEDFLTRLARNEVRSPHPLIDLQWYRAQYPDLPDNWPDVFLHFQLHGDGELRQPSARFEPDFYARTYLELGQAHPFRHFVSQGQNRGCQPAFQQRDLEASRAHMREMAESVTVIIGAHDAQRAGVPIMALDMARAACAMGHKPLFLLDRAGPMLATFQEMGPVLVAAEGWDLKAVGEALPRSIPVLLNSAECANMATTLAHSGFPTLLMIHEMPAFLQDRDLMDPLKAAQSAGAELIVSFPRLAAALEPELGPLEAIRPGVVTPDTPLSRFKEVSAQLGGASPVFISAGQGSARKGFDLFMAAAERLRMEQPEAVFVWLGALDPWAQELADEAMAGGLNLVLPGFVTDFPAWYLCADVYLLTSRQDPGPATAFHALRMGVPIVAYDTDIGMADLISDRLGRFVPAGDIDGYVQTVQDILTAETPHERRHRRQRVRDEAAFATYAARLLESAERVKAAQDRAQS